MENNRTKKIIGIIIALIALMGVCYLIYQQHKNTTNKNSTHKNNTYKIDITDEEKEILKKSWVYEDAAIESKEFSKDQAWEIKTLRLVEKYLKEKYPNVELKVTSFVTPISSITATRDYYEYKITDGKDEENNYAVRLDKESSDKRIFTDNYYKSFVDEYLENEVKKLFENNGYEVLKIKAYCGEFLGKEYDANLSKINLLHGNPDADVNYMITINDALMNSGYESHLEKIKEFLKNNNIKGSFNILTANKYDAEKIIHRSGVFDIK